MTRAIEQRETIETTTASWRVMLEGDLFQEATNAVRQIALELAGLPVEQLHAGTLAELALFYGYFSQAEPSESRADATDQALRYLNAAIEKAGEHSLPPSLISGYPEIGWVVTQLAGKVFDSQETAICKSVDDSLISFLQATPAWANYDLVSGLTGIGVYALARLPDPEAERCLRLVVQRLGEWAEHHPAGAAWFTKPELLPEWQQKLYPEGHYNLGLAHGAPGPIALLARVCALDPSDKAARSLLEDGTRWLIAQAGEESGVPFFPNFASSGEPQHRGRLAWCYGDLGAASALLSAARTVERSDWESLAIKILRHAAIRRGDETRVIDPGMCHGAAGNAHLFNRLFQATGEEGFREAAQFWYATALDFRQPDVGVAGFAARRPSSDEGAQWEPCLDLFDGVTGIGLSLLAATSDIEPAWDACFMISVPQKTILN